MNDPDSLDLEMIVNRVYNLFLQIGIPLAIMKDEMMMVMKGPKLRRSSVVLRTCSLSVLVVVAATRLLHCVFPLHESVLYRCCGATGASYDHPYERVCSHGRLSFALLHLVAWPPTWKSLHFNWFAIILLGFLPCIIFSSKQRKNRVPSHLKG